MRCTPLAVYTHMMEAETARKVIRLEVQFTHAHRNVHDAIFAYCQAIGFLIKNPELVNRSYKAFEHVLQL
jgi:ADP-ribosylglycohydrolase